LVYHASYVLYSIVVSAVVSAFLCRLSHAGHPSGD
jgi:hypothetical protein